MRKIILLLFMWSAALVAAQEISVASFKLLENDLTANTTGTMERDQNGEIAALIKIVTPEQGLVFDGGMVGIVKTRQEVGEVWVYVPYGIKRITVKHPQLGVLRDYYFPISIEKARTYEMKLTMGRVETIVTHTVNKQFVVFNVNPPHAIVELDGEMLTVDGEGCAEKGVPFGTHTYRVSCANYHTEAGQVTVEKDHRAEVNVTLRPSFGWIKFDCAEELHGAHVYIDNERVGQLPLTAEGGKQGMHQIRIVKPLYKTYTQQVTVAENDTTVLSVKMIPNFAKVTVTSADEKGEIWVDGHKKGVGQWIGGLEAGEYKVEVRRESYRPVSDVIYINDLGERRVRLGAPTPIYTTLEVSSRPSRATVYIDGVKAGETPFIKDKVLIGNRQVVFKKEGYLSVEKTVELKEGIENRVTAEMEKGQDAPVVDTTKQEAAPQPQPVAKKGAEWRFILGGGAGYSSYGLNYGGEVGLGINRFSLTAEVKNHPLGEYTAYSGKAAYEGGAGETGTVELLRFGAKLGYSLPIGKYAMITPQAGLVFGPSFFKGKEYIMGEVLTWDEIPSEDYTGKVLAPDADYKAMNDNIVRLTNLRYGIVVGARLELKTANSRFGLYVTPEYVVGEGATVNAGLVIRL